MMNLSHKKVLVLYTGGTIGMIATENGYDVKKGYLTETISDVRDLYSYNMPKFIIKEYDKLIDSSNIQPEDWMNLAQDIVTNYNDYDGFVILHGTDTLAYTSSVLSFILGEIQKPVIVTGSQIPISQIRSDAISNILNSLIFAANDDIKEVCVYFDQKLLRGNRTTKASSTDFGAFLSPNFPTLADVGIDINLKKHKLLKRSTEANSPKLEVLDVPKIAILSVFPGINYDILEAVLKPPLQGLILKTYGAGNVADDARLNSILATANDRGVIIVNCTQCFYGTVKMKAYKASDGLSRVGVISGYDMTDEAAFGKLFYLLSQKDITQLQVKKAFEKNLQGEVSF